VKEDVTTIDAYGDSVGVVEIISTYISEAEGFLGRPNVSNGRVAYAMIKSICKAIIGEQYDTSRPVVNQLMNSPSLENRKRLEFRKLAISIDDSLVITINDAISSIIKVGFKRVPSRTKVLRECLRVYSDLFLSDKAMKLHNLRFDFMDTFWKEILGDLYDKPSLRLFLISIIHAVNDKICLDVVPEHIDWIMHLLNKFSTEKPKTSCKEYLTECFLNFEDELENNVEIPYINIKKDEQEIKNLINNIPHFLILDEMANKLKPITNLILSVINIDYVYTKSLLKACFVARSKYLLSSPFTKMMIDESWALLEYNAYAERINLLFDESYEFIRKTLFREIYNTSPGPQIQCHQFQLHIKSILMGQLVAALRNESISRIFFMFFRFRQTFKEELPPFTDGGEEGI